MLFELDSVADCAHLGAIRVSGSDAQRYLQGQLSCNVDTIKPGKAQYGLYCNEQGRVMATFMIFKALDDFFIILPRNNIEQTLKTLKKYARFSKLTCEDISQDWRVISLWGPHGEQETAELVSEQKSAHVLWEPNIKRAFVCGPTDALHDLSLDLLTQYPACFEEGYRLLDIQTGIATIDANTSGRFLPHRLNCHLTGAIDFDKGCFLGQEVVARMHYRAKRKHYMYRVACDAAKNLAPGEILYSDSSQQQAVAEVVDSICYFGNCEALVIMPTKNCEISEVYTQNGATIPFILLDLPYPLREERITDD